MCLELRCEDEHFVIHALEIAGNQGRGHVISLLSSKPTCPTTDTDYISRGYIEIEVILNRL